MTDYFTNREYYELIAEWANEKRLEKVANERRLKIEDELTKRLGDKFRESGVNNFPNGLKITTGLNYSITASFRDISEVYKDVLRGKLEARHFPFKQEWKLENAKVKSAFEESPELYNKYIASLVSVKPKKPSFEVKEIK